jgi:hypothetical protein
MGRLMVVMIHNSDIPDGWEREGEDPAYFYRFSPDAYAVGIAYHRGDNELALSREREAQAIANRAAECHPEIERWAMPLLSRNVAQLLERRFADPAAAIVLREANVARGQSPVTRAGDVMRLAQLYFDRREHRRNLRAACAADGGAGLPLFGRHDRERRDS